MIDARIRLQQSTQLQGFACCCRKTAWDINSEARLRPLPPYSLWLQVDSSATLAGTHAPLLRGACQCCNRFLVPMQSVAAAEAAAPTLSANVWELGNPTGWGSVPSHHVHLSDSAGMPNSLSAPDLAVVASRQGRLTGRPSPSLTDDLALGYAGAGCQVRNADCTSGRGALSRVSAAKDHAQLWLGAGAVFNSRHSGPDKVLPLIRCLLPLSQGSMPTPAACL